MFLKSSYQFLPAIIVLSACGGGTTSSSDVMSFASVPPEEEVLRTFADTGQGVQDLGAVLGSGGSISSRSATTSGISLGYDTADGETNPVSVIVSIDEVTETGMSVTIDGISYTLGEGDEFILDGEVVGYNASNDEGDFYNIFNFSGPISELRESGNGWAAVFLATAKPTGSEFATRAYAVIGTETTDEALSTLSGTATYTGDGRVSAVPEFGFENIGSQTTIRGDLTMTADFSNDTIAGELSALTLQVPGSSDRVDIAGSFALEETGFDVNTFAGNLTGDAAVEAASGLILNDDAYYSGAFFGTEAQKVGGALGGTGTLNGEAVNTYGFFAD